MSNAYISKYAGTQIDDILGSSETHESRIAALELAAGFDISENNVILNIEKDIDQLQAQLDAVRSQLAAIKSCECETTALPRITSLESKTVSIESQLTDHATKLLPVPTTSDNYCVLQVMNGEWVLQKLRITDTRNKEYNIRASTNGKVEPVSITSSDPGITDGPGAF